MADYIELSSDSNDTIIVPINENPENFYDLSGFEDKGTKCENVNEELNGGTKKRNTLEIFNADDQGDDLLNQIPDDLETSRGGTNINDANDLLQELFKKYLPAEKNGQNETMTTDNNQGINKQLLKRKISNDADEFEDTKRKTSTKKQLLELERNKRKLEQQNKKEMIEKEKAMKKAIRTFQKSINPDECLKVTFKMF